MANEMEKTFNLIEHEPNNEEIPTVDCTVVSENRLLKDFEQARSNIINVIKVGSDAVDQLGGYANSAQSAENYAALATLVKNVGELSEKLLKLHQTIETIKKVPDHAIPKTEKHDHLHFSGTTTDLQKAVLALRDMRKEKQ